MPYVNVFECIGLTRATDSAVLVSARGEVTTIPVSNVPARRSAPRLATNGQCKREWAPHMHVRSHITFERLDKNRKLGCSHPTPRSPSSSGTTCRSRCAEVGQASAGGRQKQLS